MKLLLSLLSWALLPVYIVQGLAVRARSIRLPPASGPVSGRLGEGSGKSAIRLLVFGDSTAAGVGLDSTEHGLAALLAHELHERTGQTVSWRTSGNNSAVAEQLRDHVVPHIAAGDPTHILISVSTNDAKNMHTVARFKRGFGELLYATRAKWPRARIYWNEGVDPRLVPALPSPLADIIWMRRELLNAKGRQLCLERGATAVEPLPIKPHPTAFSIDGFHAGREGYAAWARHVADVMVADLEAAGPESAA